MQPFRTKELAMEFYRECKKLSIKDRTIRDQFERAVLSILLNICEGAGRINTRDRRKFYSISLGSLRETQCLLEILEQASLNAKSDILAAHLYKLIQNPGGR
jgi:four helix bundle protein